MYRWFSFLVSFVSKTFVLLYSVKEIGILYTTLSFPAMTSISPPLDSLLQVLKAAENPEKAAGMKRFFRTGPGQYSEGDLFVGIPNPTLRKLVRPYETLSLADLSTLLKNPIHEARLLALLILVRAYSKADPSRQDEIVRLYLDHTAYINNWDLVDLSAPGILGESLLSHPRAILKTLADSNQLWKQRIAVVSTLTLIRHGQFDDTLSLARQFLSHPHDLMHKACGWMLREVGKRNRPLLSDFLRAYRVSMPRTMLRYAIEHYSPEERKEWLQ